MGGATVIGLSHFGNHLFSVFPLKSIAFENDRMQLYKLTVDYGKGHIVCPDPGPDRVKGYGVGATYGC